MRDHEVQKDLRLVNLGYKYETNMFSSLPIHSISVNYDLDL